MQFRDYFIEQVNNKSLWKGNNKDIIAFWQGLQPNQPIPIRPIPAEHKGTRYDDDGIRITGRSPFVNAVLSRLKDLLIYNSTPSTKLDVEYRQISAKESNETNISGADARYVCYVHVLQQPPKVPKIK